MVKQLSWRTRAMLLVAMTGVTVSFIASYMKIQFAIELIAPSVCGAAIAILLGYANLPFLLATTMTGGAICLTLAGMFMPTPYPRGAMIPGHAWWYLTPLLGATIGVFTGAAFEVFRRLRKWNRIQLVRYSTRHLFVAISIAGILSALIACRMRQFKQASKI